MAEKLNFRLELPTAVDLARHLLYFCVEPDYDFSPVIESAEKFIFICILGIFNILTFQDFELSIFGVCTIAVVSVLSALE